METVITSASSSTIKQLKRLIKSGKARREENTYIAEGIHLVKSYLDAKKVPTAYVLSASAESNSEIARLTYMLDAPGIRRIVIADSLFETVMQVHAAVGICILFSPATTGSIELPLARAAVLLDAVQDPGNMGTILRTTAAVGIKDVLLSQACASPWSPKSLRAGMGAQFSLNIQEDVDLPSVITASTVPMLATSLAADSQLLYERKLSSDSAWVFGNEGSGVNHTLAELASARIIIPQADNSVESLNVAVAAAICLYEQYRQSLA